MAGIHRKSGELGDDLILDEDESHDVSFAHGWDCQMPQTAYCKRPTTAMTFCASLSL